MVYTNSSQRLDKVGEIAGTGSALTIQYRRQWFGTNGFSLGANSEVYDAEIIGLFGGLEAALFGPIAGLASEIHVCTDNLNIAKEAGSVPNGSSQAAFIRFREGVKSWLQKGKKVSVQWVPSHMGIIGNEKADQEAKKYAAVLPTLMTNGVQTLAHARRVIREKKDQAWQKEWGNKGTSQAIKIYQELKIRPTTNAKSMPEMNLNREVLGWLIAARTGHGHFADYHDRFGHEEVDVHCRCGQKRSRLHPFSCSHARLHRAKLFSLTDKRPFTPNEILGTAEGVKLFAEWAPKTELFRKNREHDKPAGL